MPLFETIVADRMAEKHVEQAWVSRMSSIYNEIVTEGITSQSEIAKLAKANKREIRCMSARCVERR